MSSNSNHKNPVLSRDNYEEAFLLYVDDELTPEEKKAVDDFVLLHPDLKEELELLCGTRLSAETVSFQNKKELFANSMKVNAVDESLLLYIDNELPAWERAIVEAQLKKDETFAQQHQLLLQTKLVPEPISYPYKKELYRHTEKRIVPYWLRVAAAVVLMAGAGTIAWMNMDNTNPTVPDVAIVTPKTTQQKPAPIGKPVETPPVNNTSKSLTASTKTTASKKENIFNVQKVAAANHITKKTNAIFSKPHTAAEQSVASNHLPVAKKTVATTLQPDLVQKVATPALNNSIVTSEIGSAYVNVAATARTPDPVHAVATTTNERSGGMKGVLRKATRFIERRTGIKTVNDDNELLVGAVALKL